MEEKKELVPAQDSDKKAPSLIVAGLGASAGGLEALEAFFDNMAPDSDMAFIVVQHLSPDYKSLMVELLSKHTKMPVVRIEDGMTMEPNSVYLIPPKKNILVFEDRLLLTDPDYSHGINLPIDIFFRSLAENKGEHAIGIVLSGTGSDGMRGLRSIKEAGGMAMAQDPESAKFDGMPQSAISTGVIDFILPATDMGEQLINYIKHPAMAKSEAAEKPRVTDEGSLSKILALVRNHCGVNFTHYKTNTILRRIDRRISINQLNDIEDYVRLLEQSPREAKLLYKELLIGVTRFFRDGEAFNIIIDKILPEIISESEQKDSVRIWVTACSTGEEAYSIGMLVQEHLNKMGLHKEVKIFATDIDREAVEHASNGVYPESIAADVSAERLSRFFVCKDGNYRICRQIREMVIFATHNLLRDPPFTKIDLLTCRNMLIYLQPVLQKKVLSLFNFAIKPNRFLFLGTSETVGDLSAQFAPIDTKWKIYRNRTTLRPSVKEALSLGPIEERLHVTRTGYKESSPAPRQQQPNRSLLKVYEEVIRAYVPPTLIVDESMTLVHSFGDFSRFFRVPEGRASFDIMRMAHKDIANPLSTAMHKCKRDNQPVHYHGVRVQEDNAEKKTEVHLKVWPMPQSKTQAPLFLITIEEVKERQALDASDEQFHASRDAEQRINDLEQELQFVKENLQATIEELETSNEELQATNEELLASNEELQSTNEELQSVNEELYTVNAEYQNKIQELTELNEDVDNLMRSTNIGTLFLGEDLCVRKFTDAVQGLINLMPQDIGRPIEHLQPNLRENTLVEDAQKVLRTRTRVETEVQDKNDKWYLMNLLPYQSESSSKPLGVVITFTDIDSFKQADMERQQLATIISNADLAIIAHSLDGTITAWNRGAEAIYGYTSNEMIGRSIKSLIPEDRSEDFDKIMDCIRNGESIRSFQTIRFHKSGDRTAVTLSIAPTRDEMRRVTGVTVAVIPTVATAK